MSLGVGIPSKLWVFGFWSSSEIVSLGVWKSSKIVISMGVWNSESLSLDVGKSSKFVNFGHLEFFRNCELWVFGNLHKLWAWVFVILQQLWAWLLEFLRICDLGSALFTIDCWNIGEVSTHSCWIINNSMLNRKIFQNVLYFPSHTCFLFYK